MLQSLQQAEQDNLSAFLSSTEWGGAEMSPLSADMGTRRYYKLSLGHKTALLMDMSRAGSVEADLGAYVSIAEHLRSSGLRVPEIFHHDLATGLAIIEDMGSDSFGAMIAQGESLEVLYGLATDVLVSLKGASKENTLNLGAYEDTIIRDRLKQFVDYYMPVAIGRKTTQLDHDEFQNIWAQIEKDLPACPKVICHADYHFENIMWCPEITEKYGLIDFQDAFWGAQPYDLLNLLEDARQTVPEEIKVAMKERYCEGMSAEEKEAFESWYVFLSAQFHMRVIGLFIKFSIDNGTIEFLAHIPRLQNYITENLKNPILEPLKKWVEDKQISFDISLEELPDKA